jgi:methyltransferase family protein
MLTLIDQLMYRCPDDFDDGMGIDFRSVDLEIAGCIKQIGHLRFDVILLDAYHAYETSLRDLTFARDLLTDHGTIVVHDCDSPSEKVAHPDFIVTSWAGVTYKAYLDFVMKCDDLAYLRLIQIGDAALSERKAPSLKCQHLAETA